MKLNRLFIASLLGFSLLTTSALACEHGSGSSSSEESHWSFFGWCHHTDNDRDHDSDHDRDHNHNHEHEDGGCGGKGTGGGKGVGGGTSTGTPTPIGKGIGG